MPDEKKLPCWTKPVINEAVKVSYQLWKKLYNKTNKLYHSHF